MCTTWTTSCIDVDHTLDGSARFQSPLRARRGARECGETGRRYWKTRAPEGRAGRRHGTAERFRAPRSFAPRARS